MPGIIKKAIEAGTIDNVLEYIKEKIAIYQSKENFENEFKIDISHPENFTDENIELFGSEENIERYGNAILKNDEYLKNYKYIKENYGQLDLNTSYSSIIDVLSDENVKKIGYENIFKFFNHVDFFREITKYSNILRNIPEDMTKEKLDEIIEIYGEIPEYKGFYNEKILEAIQKAKKENIEINFNNKWIDNNVLEYIIKNGLCDNIVTILNTDIDLFTQEGNYRKNTLNLYMLKLMTPEILGELGVENVARIAKKEGIQIIFEAKEKNLLGKWKQKIDSLENQDNNIFLSLKSTLLLDTKNDDLSIEEIKIINAVLSSSKFSNESRKKFEEIIKDNPEYIRLLEIQSILLHKRKIYRKMGI